MLLNATITVLIAMTTTEHSCNSGEHPCSKFPRRPHLGMQVDFASLLPATLSSSAPETPNPEIS